MKSAYLFLLLLTFSCGPSPGYQPHSSVMGPQPLARPKQNPDLPNHMGQACVEMARSWCQRTIECKPGSVAQATCETAYFEGCCSDDKKCDRETDICERPWKQCLHDLKNLACDRLGDVPLSCQLADR